MKRELEHRLKQLTEEYQKGQNQLMALEQESANLKNTLLRISGAIQVLQELLQEQASQSSVEHKNGLELADGATGKS